MMVRGKSNFFLTFQGKPGVTLLVKVVARELSNVLDTLPASPTHSYQKLCSKWCKKSKKTLIFDKNRSISDMFQAFQDM